jgi:hypothetical protein
MSNNKHLNVCASGLELDIGFWILDIGILCLAPCPLFLLLYYFCSHENSNGLPW